MTGIETLKICVAYRYKGELIEEFPASLKMLAECEPVYEEFAGWTEDITGVRKFEDLPVNAQNYVLRLEELAGARISAIGVGPGRDQTIVRHTMA